MYFIQMTEKVCLQLQKWKLEFIQNYTHERVCFSLLHNYHKVYPMALIS